MTPANARGADIVDIVRGRLADGRPIADADVHALVGTVDRLRAALLDAARELEIAAATIARLSGEGR